MDIQGMGFTDELSSLQPGMNIGNLCIVKFLGKGAIGEVYLAQHDELETPFALKVVPKGFTPDESAEGFEQASYIQSVLQHPHILRIDDLGEEDLFYWLRMEYIEGETAPDDTQVRTVEDLMRYKKGPLAEDEVCYYLYYLLLGLDHAHLQGVVHEDLKPSNILIAEEGVKVAEMGLTKLLGHAWDDFHHLRHEPQFEPTPFDPLPGFSRALPALLSTFEYYSPEQRAGQVPDARSNLYTVGRIAYRMLTGRPGLTLDKPSEATDGIDPKWDQWITRALAYKIEDRFQNAAEMLETMPGLETADEEAAYVETEDSITY